MPVTLKAPPQPGAKGLTKPKSKIRLRLGLTPPHPVEKQSKQKAKSPVPQLPPPSHLALTTSTSTNNTTTTDADKRTSTSISRTDSRSAFAYDTTPSPPSHGHTPTAYSPGRYGIQEELSLSLSPPFETVSLGSHTNNHHPMIHPEANISRSTIASVGMDPALARQYYYPTPSASSSASQHHTVEPEVEDDAGLQHPHIRAMVNQSDDIFLMTDQQLGERFMFSHEIGFGNWGSVWVGRPRHYRASALEKRIPGGRMGRMAAAGGGYGAGGKVAFKLIHREKTAVTAARVRALWGEMKIIRSLRTEPHPSIITFEAFIITDSFAMVVMPYLSHLIPVCLSPERAITYFRQLCSAVGYLHERGITHNDIKPANVMLSYNDVPTLVDFGFANKWSLSERGSFLSDISWGTPEYLDPVRAKGLPHDERASDVWSLGITLYEILIGRTPFEENEEEEFQDPDTYLIYYERSRKGEWLGRWSMPDDLQHLIRSMVCPDPAYRITAMQAYHHPALQLPAPAVVITPHFVRAATNFDEYEQENEQGSIPMPYDEPAQSAPNSNTTKSAPGPKQKKKKAGKRDKDHAQAHQVEVHAHGHGQPPRSATPTALGESIRQHTSVPATKAAKSGVKGVDESSKARNEYDASPSKKGSKLVIKNHRESNREQRYSKNDKRAIEEDITPTKVVKPAQPLKIKDSTATLRPASRTATTTGATADSNQPLRTSDSQNPTIPTSARDSLRDSHSHSHPKADGHGRIAEPEPESKGKNKEDAILRTMSSLEGKKLRKTTSSRDILGKITRPAPLPPVASGNGEGDGDGEREHVDGVDREGEESRPVSGVEIWRAGLMGKLDEVEERGIESPHVYAHAHGDTEALTHAKVESEVHEMPTVQKVESTPSPARAKPAPASKRESIASPPRHRRGVKPSDIVHAEEVAEEQARRMSSELQQDNASPLAELRQKILSSDHEVVRFRKMSGDLMRPSMEHLKDQETERQVTGTPIIASLSRTKSIEALAMDTRLDKLSEWVKSVEGIIGEARKALSEGREPPLPLLTLPSEIASHPVVQEITHQFGLTPNTKSHPAIPVHLRTSSTQVEPATPPRYMTFAEAEETVKAANANLGMGRVSEEVLGGGVYGKKVKKERPTVSHVTKLFGQGEKDRDSKRESGMRSNTPEPTLTVPLKPPALRGVPSTPALRASTTRNVPQRKSESNLRGSRQFNTLPTVHSTSPTTRSNHPYAQGATATGAGNTSPPPFAVKQRGVYEQLLDQNPGVARHGEGWTSRNNLASASGGYGTTLSVGRSMGKTTSMMSLREKARAFLNPGAEKEKDKRETLDLTTFEHEHEHEHDHDHERGQGDEVYRQNQNHASSDQGSKRQSGGKMVQWSQSTTTIPADTQATTRPGTPGAISTLSMSTTTVTATTSTSTTVPVTKKKGLFKNFKWGK